MRVYTICEYNMCIYIQHTICEYNMYILKFILLKINVTSFIFNSKSKSVNNVIIYQHLLNIRNTKIKLGYKNIIKRSLMLTLLKSLVIPLLEYCCQLWNPWTAKDLQAIEAIQRTFTYKISKAQHLNYWERLHEHKLYSLQRRRERYIIIYIWKITQHMVPNIDGTIGHTIRTRKPPRHGTQCVIQYPTNRKQTQSLKENAITVFGPRLYNSVPKYLRDVESVKTEKFKFELDKFLESIPDQPKLPNCVTASRSNSILDQLTHLRAQRNLPN